MSDKIKKGAPPRPKYGDDSHCEYYPNRYGDSKYQAWHRKYNENFYDSPY